MTNNERRLLRVLFGISTAISLAFIAINASERISAADSAIDRFEKALAALPPKTVDCAALERELQDLRKTRLDEGGGVPRNLTELAGTVRDDLAKHGIVPLRFAITGEDSTGTVDFTINCRATSFMRFLVSHNRVSRLYGYRNLSIKPSRESGFVDVTMRLKNAQ